jgi:hypothetical protein
MQFCTYCNSYFLEDPLDHLLSKTHKANVLKSKTVKSDFWEYRQRLDKRSISNEDCKTILKLGKLELSNSDFKKLEHYLSNSGKRLGGERYEKHRRIKIKAHN